ncbi:MAG: DUF2089 domain-containing protein [Clostridia bacterium]|nr:DUF2089 domain-containing protein [Clostridia bacterium]
MRKEVLGMCPVCSSKLKVAELGCRKCGTSIRGDFEMCKLCYLTKEQKYFIEVFIKNRGNIKEIEKELGISYPTVRRNLDNVIQALGYNPGSSEETISKKEVLEKLSKGEISSEEALKLLK